MISYAIVEKPGDPPSPPVTIESIHEPRQVLQVHTSIQSYQSIRYQVIKITLLSNPKLRTILPNTPCPMAPFHEIIYGHGPTYSNYANVTITTNTVSASQTRLSHFHFTKLSLIIDIIFLFAASHIRSDLTHCSRIDSSIFTST